MRMNGKEIKAQDARTRTFAASPKASRLSHMNKDGYRIEENLADPGMQSQEYIRTQTRARTHREDQDL